MRLNIFVLTFAVCGFLYANEGLAQKPRLAVFPMNDVALETEVRSHIVGSNQFLVEPADTTLQVVQGGKELGITCKATNHKCLGELGRLGDLAYVFVGATRGNKVTVNLITVADGRVKAGKTVDLKSPQRGEELRIAVLELVHPDGLLAQVAIETGDVKADVYIGGQAMGTTPLPQALFLEAGEHDLRVRATGYEEYSRKVIVKHGQIVNLDIVMKAVSDGSVPVGGTAEAEPESTVSQMFSHPLGIASLLVGGGILVGGLVALIGGGGVLGFFESEVRGHDVTKYPDFSLSTIDPETNLAYVPSVVFLIGGAIFAIVGAAVLAGGLGITYALVE